MHRSPGEQSHTSPSSFFGKDQDAVQLGSQGGYPAASVGPRSPQLIAGVGVVAGIAPGAVALLQEGLAHARLEAGVLHQLALVVCMAPHVQHLVLQH